MKSNKFFSVTFKIREFNFLINKIRILDIYLYSAH